jgi:hypothetical protein
MILGGRSDQGDNHVSTLPRNIDQSRREEPMMFLKINGVNENKGEEADDILIYGRRGGICG